MDHGVVHPMAYAGSGGQLGFPSFAVMLSLLIAVTVPAPAIPTFAFNFPQLTI